MVDYFSFEDVQNELHLDEDELKRMVSEGELRAFRDENKMKFRKDDVEGLRKGKGTEPTIVLPGEGGGGDDGGTIFDLDSSDTAPPPEDTAVPSIDFGDTGVDSAAVSDPNSETGDTTGITEEMVFEDSDLKVHKDDAGGLGGESGETFVDEGSDTGGVTEPLQLQAEGGGAEEAGETVAEEGAAEGKKRKKAVPRPAAAAAPTGPPGSPVMTGLLFVAAAILGVVGYFFVDLIRVLQPPGLVKPAGMTQSIREMVAGKENVATKGGGGTK